VEHVKACMQVVEPPQKVNPGKGNSEEEETGSQRKERQRDSENRHVCYNAERGFYIYLSVYLSI
jgi:hypothetical protein